MKQELLNKISLVKKQITEEENSCAQIPAVLEDVIKLKKLSVVDSLKKFQAKLETELAKIEAIEEKEKREAPIKALMAQINDTMKTLKEQKSALDRARALARSNPKDENALYNSLTLSNTIGDTSRKLAKLKDEKENLALSQDE